MQSNQTLEIYPISLPTYQDLAEQHQDTYTAPDGTQIVRVPHPTFLQQKAKQLKALRRAARKQATISRRRQRGR